MRHIHSRAQTLILSLAVAPVALANLPDKRGEVRFDRIREPTRSDSNSHRDAGRHADPHAGGGWDSSIGVDRLKQSM